MYHFNKFYLENKSLNLKFHTRYAIIYNTHKIHIIDKKRK